MPPDYPTVKSPNIFIPHRAIIGGIWLKHFSDLRCSLFGEATVVKMYEEFMHRPALPLRGQAQSIFEYFIETLGNEGFPVDFINIYHNEQKRNKLIGIVVDILSFLHNTDMLPKVSREYAFHADWMHYIGSFPTASLTREIVYERLQDPHTPKKSKDWISNMLKDVWTTYLDNTTDRFKADALKSEASFLRRMTNAITYYA